MGLDFNKERKDGKGYVLIVFKVNQGVVVSRAIENLNSAEIAQIIANLETVKSEFVEIFRELIKKDNERMGVSK